MEKFSLIITHYNQMKYIKEAILSVLNQNYKNIEIIVSDDHSKEFDKDKIEEIFKKYNKKKFEYKIYQGKANYGTVKSLNNALSLATGEYILFFAADDKLANESVISNFVNEFKDKNKNIVTSQCGLYDHDLKVKYGCYVNAKNALDLNKKNSMAIYEKTCEGCFYGAGGTAYRKNIFEKYGKFNEKYKYVEDWSYWLYVTRSGEMIYYADFDSLCHRDGGISHSVFAPETVPPHIKQYYRDILNIYIDQILPYVNNFTTKEKYRIMRQFNETILYYSYFVPELSSYLKDFDNARINDKKLKYYWKIQTLKKILKKSFNLNLLNKLRVLFIYNKPVIVSMCYWLSICYFYINKIENLNSNLLLLIYTCLYVLIYVLAYFIDKVSYRLKTKHLYKILIWTLLNIVSINAFKISNDNVFLLLILNYFITHIFLYLLSGVLKFIRLYRRR